MIFDSRLRFGLFLAPYHFPSRDPGLLLRRDLELVQFADFLGYDEAFFGEHHSGGVEIVSTPELMVLAAAERTKNIRLGTGVASVPYHHPLILADRITLLDHLTHGRLIFGVGPGALPSDAHMMGIPVSEQRERLEQGMEAIDLLLYGDEPVTMETSWFTLKDAMLNLSPVQSPKIDTVVASTRSPSGPRLAGRFGAGLLSLAATDPSGGFDFLAESWSITEQRAADFGQTVDRSDWRLCAPMHVAETVDRAREQARWGIQNTMRITATGPFAAGAGIDVEDVFKTRTIDQLIDDRIASGAVVGTAEDACEKIEQLQQKTGGFGTVLVMVNDIADYPATRRCVELIAERVIPEFTGQAGRPKAAWDRMFRSRRSASREFRDAQDRALAQHLAEREMRTAARAFDDAQG